MPKIELTRGKSTIVDKIDFEFLSKFKWNAHFDGYNFYAVRTARMPNGKRKTVRMHREIISPKAGFEVDHINRNTLDNRRRNLHSVTHHENCNNRRLRKDNTSGFRGVSWNKHERKWLSRIVIDRKRIFIGVFKSKDAAIEAYKNYVK